MLRYDFPGKLAVLSDDDGSESGGCNVLDQPESLGLRMAQVTRSTEIR